MTSQLQHILDLIRQSEQLSNADKAALERAVKEADKAFEITNFKLDRTEKVKHTTAVLLEETIAELEQKRKAVEVQNRELEIETALERVRARTMAMQHSTELSDVVYVLYKQMQQLGFDYGACTITLMNAETGDTDWWMAGFSELEYPDCYHVNHFNHVGYNAVIDAWKRKEKFAAIEIKGASKKAYDKVMFTKTGFSKLPEHVKALMAGFKSVIYSMAYMRYGALLFGPTSISDTQKHILQKFAEVFEQTYTRFLDLQKAEAQAREAQIEAALERVRATSLAMMDSTALGGIIYKLYGELTKLDAKLDRCFIMVVNPENKGMTWWMAGHEGLLAENGFFVQMNQHATHLLYLDCWEQRRKKWQYLFEGKEKRDMDRFCFSKTELSRLPEFIKKDMTAVKKIHLSGSSDQFGTLVTGSFEPLPDEQQDIICRFAIVFNQAYTRFLDLQKAEAQARESQIQLALERVRAKTMAMQHSGELREIAAAVHDQLLGLGFTSVFCSIVIMDRITGDMTWWMFFPGKEYPESYHMPFCEHPFYLAQLNRWKQGEKYSVIEVSGEEKKSYDKYTFGQTEFKNIPIESQQFMMSFEKIIFSNAYMKHGAFSWGVEPIDDEHASVLQRFASVFEQCYTRFLDLQKAEAQAREAQIEAALEKIRSRSLAMHHSGELRDVIAVFFEKLIELGTLLGTVGIGLYDQKSKDISCWVGNAIQDPQLVVAPFDDAIMMEENFISQSWKAMTEKTEMVNVVYSREQKDRYFKHLFAHNDLVQIPESAREILLKMEKHTVCFIPNYHSSLFVDSWDGKQYSDEDITILRRAGKVFEQAYVRFLDLQKAEAQAREAQIETALERIRSRALAMHTSQEIFEVAFVLREQMGLLGQPQLEASVIHLYNTEMGLAESWHALRPARLNEGEIIYGQFNFQREECDLTMRFFDQYLSGQTEYTILAEGEKLKEWVLLLFEKSPDIKKYWGGVIPEFGYHHFSVFSGGALLAVTGEKVSDEARYLQRRAANVFDLAYKRYLDLQKAEAQAKEAQIETALEKVRSRTMAMQSSNELQETAAVLFNEFKKLGTEDIYQVTIGIYNEEEGVIDFRVTSWADDGTHDNRSFSLTMKEPTVLKPAVTAWKANKKSLVIDLDGETLEQWLNYRNKISGITKMSTDTGGRRVITAAFYSKGHLSISTPMPVPADTLRTLERFAAVFDSTYTRFLDLQKAEAQAREAQIEAALERVRSRSMAMHKSEEFPEVIQVVFEQFLLLDFKIDSAQFDVSFRESDDLNLWTAAPGQPYPTKLHIPYADYEVFNSIKKAKKAGHAFVSIQLTKEEKNDFFNYFFLHAPNIPEERKKFLLSSPGVVRSAVLLEKVSLAIQNYSGIPYSDAEHNILKRFAKAFEQTYVRFLDLQKAEAQAREATIEAALEKVRGKAMAMHNSDDLIATAGVLFAEMRKLGINTFRCGVGLLTKESRKAKLYSATTTNETDNLPMVGSALLDGHEVLTEMYDRWLRNEDYFPLMKGELLKAYYEKINSTFTVPTEQTEQYEQHGYFLPFSEGLFYGWAEKPYTEDEIKTLHRFKAIVDLTFRRYIELQKSEDIAREAVRSAALDRVRAEIASMRTKQDLERITPLIWKELTTLGIPFVRCGVFIMDEQEELIHTFLSTPDGKAIAAFHVPYGSTPLAGAIKFWREKKIYLTHWGLKEYAEFADAFIDSNEVEKRAHYLSSVPTGGIHLHLLPFMQGMLYVGNTNPLTEDNLHLVQSVADAFSTAYARYEDFNKIESAKAQVERTLVDLKQAQQQLVQSEKMASLGELTAGIAHEIQNPLNFVNNFSEVSNELIKEIQDIRRKTQDQTNKSEEDELLNDIATNLEKINNHGKRAADIVKGMLQHSRSSSGVKEPTDINALADEYLRLAYHGLRAKDKTFNATMKTEFDESIGNINIIPQDIGRVILNLITNAFYVVNEKAKTGIENYEPTVTVSTHRSLSSGEGRGEVLIKVKDNGNGIPDAIKEKIFQPFFTTKPTGQGTGLGLSLSYDIVKAHGGELKVETWEGEGSEFKIVLPS